MAPSHYILLQISPCCTIKCKRKSFFFASSFLWGIMYELSTPWCHKKRLPKSTFDNEIRVDTTALSQKMVWYSFLLTLSYVNQHTKIFCQCLSFGDFLLRVYLQTKLWAQPPVCDENLLFCLNNTTHFNVFTLDHEEWFHQQFYELRL